MKKSIDYMHAKANLEDLRERGEAAVGKDALAVMNSLLTDDERAESDLRAAIVCQLIQSRQENTTKPEGTGKAEQCKATCNNLNGDRQHRPTD